MMATRSNGLRQQIFYAVYGLLGAEAMMMVLTIGEPLRQYYLLATAMGWIAVGLPILLSPSVSRALLKWWWAVMAIGIFIGPFALAVLMTAGSFLQAVSGFGLRSISLKGLWTGTEILWFKASATSTVAVVTYAALVRRRERFW